MTAAPYPVIRREEAAYISTSFNEIVTCRLPDGAEKKLLMKRGGTPARPSYGHRGGVPYEAEVYHHVLAPLDTTAPRLHAAYNTGGETSLWIDYLEDSCRLEHATHRVLPQAGAWIGLFHRRNEARAASLAQVLTTYSHSYYLGWARRAAAFSRPLNAPWLAKLCTAFPTIAATLLSPPLTIIHGEYYPKNILVYGDGTIAPVDWETAAIAAGEIDLASLIDGWPDHDRHACVASYRSARWPAGPPPNFERTLAAADIYLELRWIGDGSQEECHWWRIDRLRRKAESLGIL